MLFQDENGVWHLSVTVLPVSSGDVVWSCELYRVYMLWRIQGTNSRMKDIWKSGIWNLITIKGQNMESHLTVDWEQM